MKNQKRIQIINTLGISLLLLSSFYFYQFTYLSIPKFENIVTELIKIFVILLFLNGIFHYFYKIKFRKIFLFFYLLYLSIYLLKLIFNASDIITLHSFIEKFYKIFINWEPTSKPSYVKIISYLTPFIILSTILFLLKNKLENIKKFYSILGIVISIIIIFDLIDIYKKENLINEKKSLVGIKKDSSKKVIWILYDALDPEFLNKEVNGKKVFRNLDNLKNSSLFFENAYSPGKFTNDSVPAQLMGINILKEESKNRIKIFTNLQGNKIPFIFDNTIFGKLNSKGLNVSLISSVLEYCSSYIRSNKWTMCVDNATNLNGGSMKNSNSDIDIFKDAINFYFAIFFKFKNFLKDLKIIKPIISINEKIYTDTIAFEKLNFDNLHKMNIKSSKFYADQTGLANIDDIVQTLENTNMLFLHFYIPHTHIKNEFLTKTFKLDKNVTEKYLLRYLYVDIFTQKLIDEIKLKKFDDILFVISSDHWFRLKKKSENNREYVGNSFFLVKNLNDDNRFLVKKKSSTIIIPNLIEKFFNDKLFTNEEFYNFSNALKTLVHVKKEQF